MSKRPQQSSPVDSYLKVSLDTDELEAGRSKHDTLQAAPHDYDKMARQDLEAAIWIVKSRDGAHDVLEALDESADEEIRVEKTYSRSSPPQRFEIDSPGLTEVYTFTYLRDSELE